MPKKTVPLSCSWCLRQAHSKRRLEKTPSVRMYAPTSRSLHGLQEAELATLGAREDSLRLPESIGFLRAELRPLVEGGLDPFTIRLDLLQVLDSHFVCFLRVLLRLRERGDLSVGIGNRGIQSNNLLLVRLDLRIGIRLELLVLHRRGCFTLRRHFNLDFQVLLDLRQKHNDTPLSVLMIVLGGARCV